MILSSRPFFNTSDLFEDDIYYKVREQQREESDRAFKKFTAEYLQKGEETITLAQLRDAFASSKTLPMKYFINDFIEKIVVTIDGLDYDFTIPQFPKDKKEKGIHMSVSKYNLMQNLSPKHTPESIVAFVYAIAEWIPKYAAIEERVEAAHKQRQLACTIAYDALERATRPILEEKGHAECRFYRRDNIAHIKVRFSSGAKISIEVDLLEEFLGDVQRIVQSLPQL